jgi:hypothetical protein
MNNPIPESHLFELRNHFLSFLRVKLLKFFDEDPGSGMKTVRIRDPGWKKVGSGIRDKHPESATLVRAVWAIKYPVLRIRIRDPVPF